MVERAGGSIGGIGYAKLALMRFQNNPGITKVFLNLHMIHKSLLLSTGHIMCTRHSHIALLEFRIVHNMEITINRKKNAELAAPHTTALGTTVDQ